MYYPYYFETSYPIFESKQDGNPGIQEQGLGLILPYRD